MKKWTRYEGRMISWLTRKAESKKVIRAVTVKMYSKFRTERWAMTLIK